ncbi:MAG TPA: hypothetical protein VGC68_11390 [Enterovirga sp.]
MPDNRNRRALFPVFVETENMNSYSGWLRKSVNEYPARLLAAVAYKLGGEFFARALDDQH